MDLWLLLDAATQRHDVEWHWVNATRDIRRMNAVMSLPGMLRWQMIVVLILLSNLIFHIPAVTAGRIFSPAMPPTMTGRLSQAVS